MKTVRALIFAAILLSLLARPLSAQTAAVSTDGTVTVKLGSAQVASGKVEMLDAGPIYDPSNASNLAPGGYTLKSLSVANGITTIVHQYAAASVTYTESLAGEDLKITAAVTNSSPTKTLEWVSFNLPTFSFSRNADGNLPSWFWTYLQANPKLAIHPSLAVPFGCGWAADDTYGIGLSSRTHLTKRSLWMAGYKSDGIIPAQCTPQYYVQLDAQPGDTKTVDMVVRVSATHDFKHLLGNYLADYQSQVGGLQYTPDQRPWTFCASADASWVTPANPLGFNGANRRIDTPAGAAAFVQSFATPLQGIGQGLMDWVVAGNNPRGAMYRPDFDILPPAVAANIPSIVKGFGALGLKVGVCARPQQMIWPLTPTTDGTTQLDPHSADQLAALAQRFANVTALGIGGGFYLDSTGGDFDSVALLKFIRSKVGPNVQLYSEYSTDLTLPYAGRYAQVSTASPLALQWMGANDLAMYHWLAPQMVTMVRPGAVDLETLERNELTPLIEDWLIAANAPQLKTLGAKYQDGSHLWILPVPAK